MSLADVVRAKESTPRQRQTRIVTLDIERLPGRFSADFWDLNAFKGRRIHPDMVTEWPRTICVAWRWYGSRRTEFASEWDDGREGMLRRVWDVYDDAEIVYGHNVDRFDTRKLNTEWRDEGLAPPSTFKVLDTLKEARRTFGDESNTLAALTERLGIATKTDRYSVDMARAAVAGDKTAQRKLKAYNVGDIAASEALVDALRGWIPGHPIMGGPVADGELFCPQCGSGDLEENGWHMATVQEYRRYRCRNCGGQARSNLVKRVSNTRGVR